MNNAISSSYRLALAVLYPEAGVDEGRATRFIAAGMGIRRKSIFGYFFVAIDKKLPATACAAGERKIILGGIISFCSYARSPMPLQDVR